MSTHDHSHQHGRHGHDQYGHRHPAKQFEEKVASEPPPASCCASHGKHASHGQHKAAPAANPAAGAMDAIYTCPMHPEIRQAGPGNCPK